MPSLKRGLMKLNLKSFESESKSLADQLESYFKSKGFTDAKAEEIGKECITRLSEVLRTSDIQDDAGLRSVIKDALDKATAPPAGSAASAGSAPVPSLVDGAVAIVKDVAKHS